MAIPRHNKSNHPVTQPQLLSSGQHSQYNDLTTHYANTSGSVVCMGLRGFPTTLLDEVSVWKKQDRHPRVTREQPTGCTPLDSLRNHFPSSLKSGMPQSGARSHGGLGWLLLLITPSASSALVKDVLMCYPQAIELLHLCP